MIEVDWSANIIFCFLKQSILTDVFLTRIKRLSHMEFAGMFTVSCLHLIMFVTN